MKRFSCIKRRERVYSRSTLRRSGIGKGASSFQLIGELRPKGFFAVEYVPAMPGTCDGELLFGTQDLINLGV
jgi:hypothetical protein